MLLRFFFLSNHGDHLILSEFCRTDGTVQNMISGKRMLDLFLNSQPLYSLPAYSSFMDHTKFTLSMHLFMHVHTNSQRI